MIKLEWNVRTVEESHSASAGADTGLSKKIDELEHLIRSMRNSESK